MQAVLHGSRYCNTSSYLVLIPSFLSPTLSKGKMTAQNWFHSSRKKSKKKTKPSCHTLSKKLQVAPEDFSPWNPLEEIFLAEVAQVPPRNAECVQVDVSHAELLHHPHHPVEHLVCRPLNWVWKRWMKLQITSSYTAGFLLNYRIISIKIKAQHQEAKLPRPNLPGQLVIALKMLMEWCGLVGVMEKVKEPFSLEKAFTSELCQTYFKDKKKFSSSTGL